MDKKEARRLVEACLPSFAGAGLPPLVAADVVGVTVRPIASLWAGMGHVYRLRIQTAAGGDIAIVAKRVELPAACDSLGDQRKKDSYDVEAAFYARGHAACLRAVGAACPLPLYVEQEGRGADLTICMTHLEGRGSMRGGAEAFVRWLARLHALYWGAPRADAAVASGLQAQGCYWHLDTRPQEHARMGRSGWMGRLRLAARAIDLRLKADPMQSVCHGDAKGANVLFTTCSSGRGGGGAGRSSAQAPTAAGGAAAVVPLVYDFQYAGKACVAKDLAYFFNVEAGAAQEDRLLRVYHAELSAQLAAAAHDDNDDWDDGDGGGGGGDSSGGRDGDRGGGGGVGGSGESGPKSSSPPLPLPRRPPPPSLEALRVGLDLALCDWRRFSEVGLGGWGEEEANARVRAVLDRLDGGRALDSEQAYVEAMSREYPVAPRDGGGVSGKSDTAAAQGHR